MGKFVGIQTKLIFESLWELGKIDNHSLNFILDTGQIYTHGIYINSAVFGTAANGAVSLSIAGTTNTLALSNHSHSNYLLKNANIDLTSYKIVSGSKDLLYYSGGNVYVGNSSSPTYLYGTSLSTVRNSTTYTVLDTGNFDVVTTLPSGYTFNNTALIKYGSSSFLIDYVKRINTSLSFDSLNTYTLAGTNLLNGVYYGYMTLYTDNIYNSPSWAQLRINIPNKVVEFRTSADTSNWLSLNNTDNTSIKLGTAGSTNITDGSTISANSSSGIIFQGGTNSFKVGNGTNSITVSVGHGLSTKNITINGSAYALYTSASSLPTILAPTSYAGTGGLVLATNSNKNGLTWTSLPTKSSWNYDDVYTKKTQAIPVIIGPSTDTTAGTWTGTTDAFSAYANGLTIIYVPAVAGASTTTLNINGLGAKTCHFTNTSKLTTHFAVGTPIMFTYYGGYWKRADYDSNSNTQYYLTLNGTVNGHSGKTNLGTIWAPSALAGTGGYILATNSDKTGLEWVAKPAANVTTSAVVGSSASATTQISANQSNPYYNLIEGSSVTRSIQFKGGGTTSITSDANGVITISSSDSKTGTVTSVATGIGLTGGTITTSGTLKVKLQDETLNSTDSTKSTSTSGGLYAVEADKSGNLAVRVPWTDHTYTVNNATYSIKSLIGSTTTTLSDFTANQSSNDDFTLVQGSNITFTNDTTNRKLTIAGTANTKVTSVGNHYTPSADANAELTASIIDTAGTYAINTEYTVLTGVKAQRDAKGHITGLTYTAQNIKDTWRGIQDNLTSSTNTTESLSAKQGYLLANGSARDSTKLPLAGGTMTGPIDIGTGTLANISTAGLNFGNKARIANGATNFGIFATGSIYIRPALTITGSSFANANGLELSETTAKFNGYTIYHSGNIPSNSASAKGVVPAGVASSVYMTDASKNPSWTSIDTTVTSGSTNLVTSGAIFTAIANKVAGAVQYLGTIDSEADMQALSSAGFGDFARVATSFSFTDASGAAVTAHVGDVVYMTSSESGAYATSANWVVAHTEIDTDTWTAASTSASGYIPKLVTGGANLSAASTDYVLSYVNGATTPSWRKLPANAYLNTWTALSTSAAGYVPAASSGNSVDSASSNTYYFLGYTGSTIKWYKLPANAFNNDTYTGYNIVFLNNAGTTVDTFKALTSPNKTLKAGTNVQMTAASNVITITATDTWNANALGVAGYVAAPTKANNSNMTWLTDAEGIPAWRASNNHNHDYLPLSGGNMSGSITMSVDESTAFNTKGILFGSNGSAGRISGSTTLGIYAAGTMYLRPDSASSNSGTGLVISSSSLTYNGTNVSLAGHKHAYTDLTGSSTTANQAIVSNGTANGWTLKTLGSNAFNSTTYATPDTTTTLTRASADLTKDTWADAGTFADSIAEGTWVVSFTVDGSIYSGIFSRKKGDTMSEEISLHAAGTSTKRIYARTTGNKFLIVSADETFNPGAITFNFRKLI